MSNQVIGHRLQPTRSRARHLREAPIVAGRQVVMDGADFVGDQMKIVEEPFGRGRNRLAAMDVVCDGAIDLGERMRLPIEAPKMSTAMPASCFCIERKQQVRQFASRDLQARQIEKLTAAGCTTLVRTCRTTHECPS